MYKFPENNNDKNWIVLGSELSPFTLKVLNYLSFYQIPHQFYYTQGNTWQNIKIQIKKTLLVAGLTPLTWPKMSQQDEFPLVPFLFGPDGEALYDSTAIAHWLEQENINTSNKTLFPARATDAKLDFLQHLIDEFFDDWGLYLVHHNRWKVACLDNNAGARLSFELKSMAGPFSFLANNFFSNRQTRRMPYLFSVAPNDFDIPGAKRQPPAHKDFPPTHDLLEQSFARILVALEKVFSCRAYLFGDCYTLADASIYGQLAMNLPDVSAAKWIAKEAPHTYGWLQRLADLDFTHHHDSQPQWHDDLMPLIDEISRIYLPLMDQNERAYNNFVGQGQEAFNERAFWKGQAIYAGKLDGMEFKTVAKSFQVTTWKVIKQKYQSLDTGDQEFLQHIIPNAYLLAEL